MSEIIDILIKSNTLNFLIVVGIVIFLLTKLDIKKKLQETAENVKNFVESAENEKINAQKRLDIINSKVDKLPEVTERIRKSTQNSIKNYENKVQSDLEEEKKDISNNAKRLFQLETKNFKNKLTNILSEESVEIAKENAIKQLQGNNQLQYRYIDSAIDELDGIKL